MGEAEDLLREHGYSEKEATLIIGMFEGSQKLVEKYGKDWPHLTTEEQKKILRENRGDPPAELLHMSVGALLRFHQQSILSHVNPAPADRRPFYDDVLHTAGITGSMAIRRNRPLMLQWSDRCSEWINGLSIGEVQSGLANGEVEYRSTEWDRTLNDFVRTLERVSDNRRLVLRTRLTQYPPFAEGPFKLALRFMWGNLVIADGRNPMETTRSMTLGNLLFKINKLVERLEIRDPVVKTVFREVDRCVKFRNMIAHENADPIVKTGKISIRSIDGQRKSMTEDRFREIFEMTWDTSYAVIGTIKTVAESVTFAPMIENLWKIGLQLGFGFKPADLSKSS